MTDLLNFLKNNEAEISHEHPYENIKEHLMLLLNTRRESLPHLNYYGLPDLSMLYTNLPYTEEALMKAIIETIKTHEPRLSHVHVEKDTRALEGPYLLGIIIRGITQEDKQVEYNSYFSTQGMLQIEEWL